MTWTPRSPQEALVYCDTLLAELTPKYRHALERLAELLPGHSGRPVGSGEPGGGSGFTATSVVERAATNSPERNRLDRAQALPALLVDQAEHIAGQTFAPKNPTDHQRLALAAWIVRRLAQRPHLPAGPVRRLHADICELHDIVMTATRDPANVTPIRSPALASDLTGQWCTSCLRIGAREPRSDRYTTDALCRWCGDFQATQGWLPTPPLVEAHCDRRKITEAMVNAERPRKRKGRR